MAQLYSSQRLSSENTSTHGVPAIDGVAIPMKELFVFCLKIVQVMKAKRELGRVFFFVRPVMLVVVFYVELIRPGTVKTRAAEGDAVMQSLMQIVLSAEEFADMPEDEAMTRYFLRSLAIFFLLMPLGISSISAAYSIVGEKQQRTLEPILATP